MNECIAAAEGNLAELEDYLTGRNISLETARRFRLGLVRDGRSPLNGRLLIPYLTRAGPVCLKARCIRCVKCEGHGKYTYESGSEHLLYNATAFFEPGSDIVVTEGEFDCMAAQAATGLPVVSYPGVSAWKDFFARAFAGYGRVLVVADGDEPGREAARDVAKKVGRFADSALVIRMPDGHDSNSFIAEFGAQAYRETLGV